ncbi:hypothetical protein ICN41_07245 [Polynucleobacter sp. 15G-AUS-farblos]|uniref:glycosyltransferase family 10 domain-containing protein n=1 Tax=Polynucleobacter sp. 15G-AUS-farblos TaxID=2689094 RepID=UPI001C0AD7B9|nr:glycosyltransferase family 10 [Polynucleobacter sp. 15G-AUS-farblos]MBU3583786.1 hypothetical protein [Polynucleobacter sp. 15G-AUS-farblos]
MKQTLGIVGWEAGDDDLFNPQSLRNRDDCLEPFRVLRAKAAERGIELHTIDVLQKKGLTPSATLYLESLPITPINNCKNYLIRFETELTVPINGDADYLNQFDGIFTWDQVLLSGDLGDALNKKTVSTPKFPIAYPNVLPRAFKVNQIANPGFAKRDLFCILIGSNRHANVPDARELYSERVKAIRWFEENALKDFALFGNGWMVPQKRQGKSGKWRYRLEKILPFLMGKAVFPSYQGSAKSKFEVLSKSRFCICYENAKDIPGYITEKLFDALFAGCVPIYWGEPQVESLVPAGCFIDFRQFASSPNPYQKLYQYLSKMSEQDYISHQEAGRQFLASPAFRSYSSEAFAEAILGPLQL